MGFKEMEMTQGYKAELRYFSNCFIFNMGFLTRGPNPLKKFTELAKNAGARKNEEKRILMNLKLVPAWISRGPFEQFAADYKVDWGYENCHKMPKKVSSERAEAPSSPFFGRGVDTGRTRLT